MPEQPARDLVWEQAKSRGKVMFLHLGEFVTSATGVAFGISAGLEYSHEHILGAQTRVSGILLVAAGAMHLFRKHEEGVLRQKDNELDNRGQI